MNKLILTTLLAFTFFTMGGLMTTNCNTEYFSLAPSCEQMILLHDDTAQANA